MRYNKDLLDKYCKENDVILHFNYEHLNRETIISGKCKNSNCNNDFKKTFRVLLRTNNFCHSCSVINGKIKSYNTNLIKYGCCNPLQNEQVKNKMKQTNMDRYGVENTFQYDEFKTKIAKTIKQKYGVDHISKCKESNEKKIQTYISKYGCKNPMQNENIKRKHENTNIAMYGFKCATQNENVKNKMQNTNLEKYGVKYTFQSSAIKNKIQDTLFKKYGVKYISQNEDIKNKIKATMIQKYGASHISQSVFFAYKYKPYILPSGKIIKTQGYENFALDLLVQKYSENDIINNRRDVPRIEYIFKGKISYYFPDIFIPSENLIIEVKSEYTYALQLIRNILKAHAVRRLNYNYEVWIFDTKKNLLVI